MFTEQVSIFKLYSYISEGIKESQPVAVENIGHGFYYREREKINSELLRFIG
jgi:hypothetical protein